MTYDDLQRENKTLLERMEALTALILAIELEGQERGPVSIREVLQAGSSRADGYRHEREILKARLQENMDKLELFLMTAERRSELVEMLKNIEA